MEKRCISLHCSCSYNLELIHKESQCFLNCLSNLFLFAYHAWNVKIMHSIDPDRRKGKECLQSYVDLLSLKIKFSRDVSSNLRHIASRSLLKLMLGPPHGASVPLSDSVRGKWKIWWIFALWLVIISALPLYIIKLHEHYFLLLKYQRNICFWDALFIFLQITLLSYLMYFFTHIHACLRSFNCFEPIPFF